MLRFIQFIKDAFKGLFLVALICSLPTIGAQPSYCGNYLMEIQAYHTPAYSIFTPKPQMTIRQKAWQAHRTQVSRILYNH